MLHCTIYFLYHIKPWNNSVYIECISFFLFQQSEESITTQTDARKNKYVYSTPQTNCLHGMCVPDGMYITCDHPYDN